MFIQFLIDTGVHGRKFWITDVLAMWNIGDVVLWEILGSTIQNVVFAIQSLGVPTTWINFVVVFNNVIDLQ